MEVSLIYLIGSLVLLWMPGYLYLTREGRERVSDSYGSNGLPLSRIVLAWQNWMDAARGIAGAYGLTHLAIALDSGVRETYYYGFAGVGVVLAIAIVMQVVYIRRHVFCLSPIFFVSGMIFVLVDWWIALYAVVVGLFFGRIINSSEGFFFCAAATVAVFGYLFHGIDIEWMLTSGLLFLPIVCSLTAQESLVVVIRRWT